MSQSEFNHKNNRRIIENPHIKTKRDYDDYTKFINQDGASKK